MIDLHNHILPGADDGAADLQESIAIARQFVSEGVVRLAATSHLDPERNHGIQAPVVREKVAAVREALRDNGVELDVLPGNELYLTPDAPELLNAGIAVPLGDSAYVLVELSLWSDRLPAYLEQTISRLLEAGYRPIMAHPSRYPPVQRDPAIVEEWISWGVPLQLTAGSLLGGYGRVVQQTAERLLERDCYLLAASDRHHPDQDRSLAALHKRITRLRGRGTADLLLRINPARVLMNEPLLQPHPTDSGAEETSDPVAGT